VGLARCRLELGGDSSQQARFLMIFGYLDALDVELLREDILLDLGLLGL